MNTKLKEIITKIKAYSPDADIALIEKAYSFAEKHHQGQTRESGEKYFTHPLEVANILADLKLDIVTIASGILHDTIEDTEASLESIRETFSEEISDLVEGVTKIGKLTFRSDIEKQAENFRKMVVAMAKDIRVLLIKLADRTHNIRTLEYLPKQKQLRIANETLEIYAPLAHRMGIHWIKAELEDWSFRYIHPEVYHKLSEKIAKSKKERERLKEQVIKEIQKQLDIYNVGGEVSGRPKHFYSIFIKMETQKIEFEQVFDIMAFRIITSSVQECYEALGVIHSIWKPVPGRFKDYIAMPKTNFYQSLHTTVIGPRGERVEIQIRTDIMHNIAERGIAAHWKYKEGYLKKNKEDHKFAWLSQLIENHQNESNPHEFVKSVKMEIFTENIYVFTPTGEVKEVPRGSTPVDFAFFIHTQVGLKCSGAKVNGKLVPLKYKLRSGDTIEIITAPNAKPSKDWLSFVKTSRARSKIRSTIIKEEREKARELGKQICETNMRKHGLSLSKIIKTNKLLEVAKQLKVKDMEDLFLQIGYGKINPSEVSTRLIPKPKDPETVESKKDDLENFIQKFSPEDTTNDIVTVAGIPNIMIKFAKCCTPVPGENIIGFITRGRGVTIHTTDCAKISDTDEERHVEATWNVKESKDTTVKIRVLVTDSPGILHELTSVMAEHNVNISSLNIETIKDKKAICVFGLNTFSISYLNKVIDGLGAVPGVISVKRVKS